MCESIQYPYGYLSGVLRFTSRCVSIAVITMIAGCATFSMAPTSLHDLIQHEADRHRLPAELVAAIITIESGGNICAISSVGAMGLMQLMPATAKELQVVNPFDPKQNVSGGVRYLAWLMSSAQDNPYVAAAMYNHGPRARLKAYEQLPKETRLYLIRLKNQLVSYESASWRSSLHFHGNSCKG